MKDRAATAISFYVIMVEINNFLFEHSCISCKLQCINVAHMKEKIHRYFDEWHQTQLLRYAWTLKVVSNSIMNTWKRVVVLTWIHLIHFFHSFRSHMRNSMKFICMSHGVLFFLYHSFFHRFLGFSPGFSMNKKILY